jgi:flagellar L-ring protein precursor FlgH
MGIRHQNPLLLATAAIALGGPACADSIWQRRDPQHAYLFIDTKARCVGDLLTVIVSQDTDVNNRDNREMSKESEISEKFNFAGASSGGLGEQSASASLDLSNEAEREFKGDATYRSQRAFTDRVTVTVMDVLPNGNLVVAGKRRVWIGGDETVLVLTGVVRDLDIGPDNSIHSRFISELSLSYENRGPEKSFTRQGWLGRKMNHVWPF